MADLSDVIGKAVSGELGQQIDKLIDLMTNMHNKRFEGHPRDMVSDLDIVMDALSDYAWLYDPSRIVPHYDAQDFELMNKKITMTYLE